MNQPEDLKARGFVSKLIEGSLTWTHTTRLGDFLAKAETRFGERDKEWTILGIEFFGDDPPHIWFPGDRGHVVVRLSESARFDEPQALFQLAHETVHLLSPNGGGAALNIEEGMATIFAEDMIKNIYPEYDAGAEARSSYASAKRLTEELLTIDFDAVRRMRFVRPRIQDFTPDFITGIILGVSAELAEGLCTAFVR